MKKQFIFCFLILSAVASIAQNRGSNCVNYHRSLKSICDSMKITASKLRFVIDKSDYEMSVYKDTIKIKSYPVVFGFNAIDDKLQEGDGCTPEGFFKIRAKYPHASWSKFMWIDYPTTDSWKKHNAAKKSGKIPADSRIGGEVGIHGVPEGYDSAIDQKQNWTLGCISLKNKDVNEIYQFITPNATVIEIRK